LSYIMYKDPAAEEDAMVEGGDETVIENDSVATMTQATEETISAPIKGEAVPLSEVNDGMFSEEILGKGVAIKPAEGVVVSPISGTITATFDSKHAIGLTSDNGMELLIHVGIDTVQLDGEGYEYFVEKDQRVEVGDKLIEFDLEGIANKGYDTITPVVITNSADYGDIISLNKSEVAEGEQVIKVMK